MSEEKNGNVSNEEAAIRPVRIDGMYEDWFLDYASYVILERAVPLLYDGMKPVQRRILHAMKEMDDGRFHKVANIIGQTMQYHPHGDAAIGDALVKLGQKDLLIDTQGNWGDVRTGDNAAAPRYIEARLTPFALRVLYNPDITEWQLSYDGRKKEPTALPAKFPLLLAQGVEGIAVGLSTKILPHNFIELCEGAVKVLQGKKTKILPDFYTGGMMDASDYNRGKRGGRIKVRAKIQAVEKRTLQITEIPFGTTTSSIIDSIIKANDKGKIKIKRVTDNTAKDVSIEIDLPAGVSPDVTIDALYAFTNCEVSISVNACVIVDNKPHFLSVDDILEKSAFHAKEILRRELEIRKKDAQEKWHLSSLERLFIEHKIYRDIEECETWEAVVKTIYDGIHQYISTPSKKNKTKGAIQLHRDVTKEDIVKLTEIKIKRISKFDMDKADEYIKRLEEELKQIEHHLNHLTEYTIDYFKELKEKYGKGKERKTVIQNFENIEVQQVAANNVKLYVNRKEGFIGSGLRKDEFVKDCSDLDDIIAFRKDGTMMVVKMGEKKFVGKDILYVDVWRKGDERTVYHMIYADINSGKNYVKRFQVKAITRDKEYNLAKSNKTKVIYFSVHPNSEKETVSIQLSNSCKARVKTFDYDFGELSIKGRNAAGNVITKWPIRKVDQKELGESTLGGIDLWIDESIGRLNKEERGTYLGSFDTGNQILVLYKDGTYELTDFELTNKYEMKYVESISKWNEETIVSAIYVDGDSGDYYVKRFQVETKSQNQRFSYISEHKKSSLLFVSTEPTILVEYTVIKGKKKERVKEQVQLDTFIDIKGWKALGNKITPHKITGKIKRIQPDQPSSQQAHEEPVSDQETQQSHYPQNIDKQYKPGDTLELDF